MENAPGWVALFVANKVKGVLWFIRACTHSSYWHLYWASILYARCTSRYWACNSDQTRQKLLPWWNWCSSLGWQAISTHVHTSDSKMCMKKKVKERGAGRALREGSCRMQASEGVKSCAQMKSTCRGLRLKVPVCVENGNQAARLARGGKRRWWTLRPERGA